MSIAALLLFLSTPDAAAALELTCDVSSISRERCQAVADKLRVYDPRYATLVVEENAVTGEDTVSRIALRVVDGEHCLAELSDAMKEKRAVDFLCRPGKDFERSVALHLKSELENNFAAMLDRLRERKRRQAQAAASAATVGEPPASAPSPPPTATQIRRLRWFANASGGIAGFGSRVFGAFAIGTGVEPSRHLSFELGARLQLGPTINTGAGSISIILFSPNARVAWHGALGTRLRIDIGLEAEADIGFVRLDQLAPTVFVVPALGPSSRIAYTLIPETISVFAELRVEAALAKVYLMSANVTISALDPVLWGAAVGAQVFF